MLIPLLRAFELSGPSAGARLLDPDSGLIKSHVSWNDSFSYILTFISGWMAILVSSFLLHHCSLLFPIFSFFFPKQNLGGVAIRVGFQAMGEGGGHMG